MGMSENISIAMEERSETRKGACKKLRPAGFTPCVFYGPEYVQSIPGKVRTAEVVKLVNSGDGRRPPSTSLSRTASGRCVLYARCRETS